MWVAFCYKCTILNCNSELNVNKSSVQTWWLTLYNSHTFLDAILRGDLFRDLPAAPLAGDAFAYRPPHLPRDLFAVLLGNFLASLSRHLLGHLSLDVDAMVTLQFKEIQANSTFLPWLVKFGLPFRGAHVRVRSRHCTLCRIRCREPPRIQYDTPSLPWRCTKH